MPVARQSFLFQYFDKMICGVVALAILAAVVYAYGRAGRVARVAPPARVREDIRLIEDRMEEPGPPETFRKKDYVTAILKRLEQRAVPRTMPADGVIYPEPPESYEPAYVGIDGEFVLEFDAPLDKGSVKVEGEEGLVELMAHPDGDDYKKVRLKSGAGEGEVTVAGMAGGLRHQYPVTIDSKVGKSAHPPVEIEVTAAQRQVTVTITPDPRNEEDDVEVVGYEVWRRDWVDPLGDYRKVGDVGGAAGGVGLMARTPMAFGPGGPFMGARMTAAGAGAQVAAGTVAWPDADVTPGEKYSYKVRTVGANTYPEAGEFTEPYLVEVAPELDFRFSSSRPGETRFEVARLSSVGISERGTFWVSVGDDIGGVLTSMRGGVNNLLTGAVLVDFHRNVMLPERRLISDRAIYADSEGNLFEQFRWRRGTESQFWDAVEGVRQIGRMGMPGGPGAAVPPGFLPPEAMPGYIPPHRRIEDFGPGEVPDEVIPASRRARR
ncbi:MAG: hypothetical protein KAX44_00625 [Candidatus Brocadiae bacterium]|nr:hypothetical protein [Candidatus Brocadiia bacterium]